MTANLVDADGNVAITATTDEKGNYFFGRLPVGTYSTKVVQDGPIAPLKQIGDPDATEDNSSEPIILNNGNPPKTDVDFNYVNNNSLLGTVYRDGSRNGDHNSAEPGYSGVAVQLLDKDGNVVGTTTTDKDGKYPFGHPPDGTYSVKVARDGEFADTDQTEDPDTNKGNTSEPITLDKDNPTKDNIGFGYVSDYSVHGLVYHGGDRDETHGVTEKGYVNQTVELRDKDGEVVTTATTDEDSAYPFSKLPTGDYTVKVVKDGTPTDLDRMEDPGSAKDSTSGIISLSNDYRTEADVNFGYIANSSVNGTIYRDDDHDGKKGDIGGRYSSVVVQLLDKGGKVTATMTTGKDGTYSFKHLPDGDYPVKAIEDGTFTDTDQTGDPGNKLDSTSEPITLDEENPTKGDVGFGYVSDNTTKGAVYRNSDRSGSYTDGEETFSGMTVDLLDKDNKIVATTMMTDRDGKYSFFKLSAGTYRIKVYPDGDSADLGQIGDPDGIADSMPDEITIDFNNQKVAGVDFDYVVPGIPVTKPKQGLTRTGFDDLIGGVGLGAVVAGGMLLWMRRLRQD